MKGGGRLTHAEYTKSIKAGDDCSSLNFDTTLANITDIGKTLKKGDVLVVKIIIKDVIGVYKASGEFCGNISSPFNIQLIECINKGNKYQGMVLDTFFNIHVEIVK